MCGVPVPFITFLTEYTIHKPTLIETLFSCELQDSNYQNLELVFHYILTLF